MSNVKEAQSDRDPFAQHVTVHSALRESHELSTDIYHGLFDSFFSCAEFQRWLHRESSWQLHCIGGPGTGKTTLLALTVRHIRRVLSQPAIAVATIYINGDVIHDERAFLEDVLHSVYTQLLSSQVSPEGASNGAYNAYEKARRTGERASTRIDFISRALHTKLAETQQSSRFFLLIDGFDGCSLPLQEALGRQLESLQGKGLSVLIASRLPLYEKQKDVFCDVHERDMNDGPEKFYYRCMNCENFDICLACMSGASICSNCGVNTIWKEPDYINRNIDRVFDGIMESFIAWDLEREHGDLGLESENPRKPPLSSLGRSFQTAGPGLTASDWVRKITMDAYGNIAFAKLGLDTVHNADCVDGIDLWAPDRLPKNVQYVFDEGLREIEEQPKGQRELALKTMAAVAQPRFASSGIPLSRLAALLRERPQDGDTHTKVFPRSAEDILHATKGYLFLQPPWYEGHDYAICAYHELFNVYAQQGYHDELTWAKAQLRTSNIPRSQTRIQPRDDSEEQELPIKEILGELRRFHSQSPGTIHASLSPPVRPGVAPKRSSTLVELKADRSRTKPTGLGLRF